VAVVAYGGYASGGTNMSRSQRMLQLGHYDIAGDYLSISGNRISVNPAIPAGMVITASVTVEGGTPTQRGIAEGAKMLTENSDTAYTYITEKGREVSLTRRPVMVLLTDGDPTFAWSDYTMEGAIADNSYTHGDGNVAGFDMGADLLTVLTASYWKQRVRDHYYGDNNFDMQFFTIGVGVSGVHAPAVMDPVRNAAANTQAFSSTTYSMKTLLDQFTDPDKGSITFPAFNKGSTSVRSLVTVVNPSHFIKSYAYTDGYFPTDNSAALGGAFQTIASYIVTAAHYTTESDPSRPDFSGYLIITDPIGQYMEFKDNKGTWVDGHMYVGRSLAASICGEAEGGSLWDYWSGMMAACLNVSKSTAVDIIATNIAGGALFYHADDDFLSTMRWYVDSASQFVGLYFDRDGAVLPPPPGATAMVELHPMHNEVNNGVSGEATTLLCMYLEVLTALQADDFSPRGLTADIPLEAGQQLVNWYVPASLIPMRTVSEVYDAENPDKVTGLDIKEAYPIRVSYTVGLQADFDTAQLSDAYKAQHKLPTGNGYAFYTNSWSVSGNDSAMALFEPNKYNPYYYFTEDTPVYLWDGDAYILAENDAPGNVYFIQQEYFDQDVLGYIAEIYILIPENTRILCSPSGKPYVPGGERKPASTAQEGKTDNATGTSALVLNSSFDSNLQINRLGNNGRLTLSGLSDLTVCKVWQGAALDAVWIQLYRDGQPYRSPIMLSEENEWQSGWTDLMPYDIAMDENGQIAGYSFLVAEGSLEDTSFTPYSEENPLEGYTIEYVQPLWLATDNTWSGAVVTNTAENFEPGQENRNGNGSESNPGTDPGSEMKEPEIDIEEPEEWGPGEVDPNDSLPLTGQTLPLIVWFLAAGAGTALVLLTGLRRKPEK